jgi:hypothetical protein
VASLRREAQRESLQGRTEMMGEERLVYGIDKEEVWTRPAAAGWRASPQRGSRDSEQVRASPQWGRLAGE